MGGGDQWLGQNNGVDGAVQCHESVDVDRDGGGHHRDVRAVYNGVVGLDNVWLQVRCAGLNGREVCGPMPRCDCTLGVQVRLAGTLVDPKLGCRLVHH